MRTQRRQSRKPLLHEPPVQWYRRRLLPAQALAWTKSPTMSTYSFALLRGVGGEMDEFHAEALRFGCLRVRPQPLVARASRASASTGPRVSDEARSPSRSWCLLSPPSPRLTLTSIPTFPRHSKGFQALLAVPSRSRGASRDGAPPRGSVADAGRTARAGQSEVRALHRPRRGLLTPHPGG